jgi:hypothetical protein
MWTAARYWFRLTLEEFGNLTPPEFWELWEQRHLDFTRQWYVGGITASAIYNVNRSDSKQRVFTPLDFAVTQSPEESQRDEIISVLKSSFLPLRADHPERIPEARAKCLSNLTARGIADPEEIIREVFGE